MKMNWEQLLSLDRYGDNQKRLRIEQDELRLGYDVDFDRIIFSKHFRSLQDKTQVIPLSKNSFVHTRLTHSLEVSVVGRSLGRMAGKLLLKKHPDLKKLGYKSQDFGAIVAAACLAHDIGNPPFGHTGEKAIGSYFASEHASALMSTLSRKQQQDLLSFEGNANGYRLLNMSTPGTRGGLRLSYATLGAFIKYPKESLPIKPSGHISQKKFGVFQHDWDHFLEVATALGLKNDEKSTEPFKRHPLAFLVEAADDICYTIIDFEDGINLGWISEDYALEYFINLVRDTIRNDVYVALQTTSERLSYLRSLAINNLIADCVHIFMTYEEDILAGTFESSLTDLSKFKTQLDDIIMKTVGNVYKNKEVVSKEIAGYKMLTTITQTFTTAAINKMEGKETHYDLLILSLFDVPPATCVTVYDCIMHVCSEIASLTDGKVSKIFETINGQNREF